MRIIIMLPTNVKLALYIGRGVVPLQNMDKSYLKVIIFSDEAQLSNYEPW